MQERTNDNKRIRMGKGVLVPTYKCNQRCTCCYASSEIEKECKYTKKELLLGLLQMEFVYKIKIMAICL